MDGNGTNADIRNTVFNRCVHPARCMFFYINLHSFENKKKRERERITTSRDIFANSVRCVKIIIAYK